jgi:hypothetical protein
MGVDHRGFDILMPKQLLNCSDVIAILKQMRSKTVAQRVAADTLVDADLARGITDRTPHVFIMPMMTCDITRAWVSRPILRRKEALPAQLNTGTRILAQNNEGVGPAQRNDIKCIKGFLRQIFLLRALFLVPKKGFKQAAISGRMLRMRF